MACLHYNCAMLTNANDCINDAPVAEMRLSSWTRPFFTNTARKVPPFSTIDTNISLDAV